VWTFRSVRPGDTSARLPLSSLRGPKGGRAPVRRIGEDSAPSVVGTNLFATQVIVLGIVWRRSANYILLRLEVIEMCGGADKTAKVMMTTSLHSNRRTFVLIPGAWMGAWSWHPVARLLKQDGHDVLALTVPGLSYGSSPEGLRLADAVDFVVREIEARDLRDVVLVSHSWGGYPATGAAHRLTDRIAKVVYYNAVVPAQGVSMTDENDVYGKAIQDSINATPDRTVTIPLEAIRAGLMHDESPELQELVFALTLPQPGGYMVDALDGPAVTDVGLPAAYLLGEEDRSLARPGDEFAARLGVLPVLVPGSHMAMLSRPADIAAALTAVA
jgi:pimeloyl-ACP methyl ester carboxylesterase